MKNQSIMKTAFLLLALLGGVSTAWADDKTILAEWSFNYLYDISEGVGTPNATACTSNGSVNLDGIFLKPNAQEVVGADFSIKAVRHAKTSTNNMQNNNGAYLEYSSIEADGAALHMTSPLPNPSTGSTTYSWGETTGISYDPSGTYSYQSPYNYFEIRLNTANYASLEMEVKAAGHNCAENGQKYVVMTSPDGSTWTQNATVANLTSGYKNWTTTTFTLPEGLNNQATCYVRIVPAETWKSSSDNQFYNNQLNLDWVKVRGTLSANKAQITGVSITGQTVTTGSSTDWNCILPVAFTSEYTTFSVSKDYGTVAATAKDSNDEDVTVTDNADETFTLATPNNNTATIVTLTITPEEGSVAPKTTYTLRLFKLSDITITALTVDGIAEDVLSSINTGSSYTASISSKVYTEVPPVVAALIDGSVVNGVPSGSGTTRSYTISATIGSDSRTFTLDISGIHTYTPSATVSTFDIKNNGGTRENNTWTSSTNSAYTLATASLDGASEYFKFNSATDVAYTLTIPSYAVVKQFVIKHWVNNYSNTDKAYLKTVTSTGATAIIPTKNWCVCDYKAGNNESRKYEGEAYDLVVNIENHQAGTPIVFTMKDVGQPMGWIQLVFEKEVTFDENETNTIVALEGATVHLTRSISAGNWSTIVLPFDMTAEQVSSTFGTNVKLAQFTGYNSSTKVLTMSEVTTMNANEPYFIKVTEGEYTSPVEIQGVTIVASDNVYTDVSGVRFQGVYVIGKIPSGAYFANNNNLYHSNGNSNIKPFRAYFKNVQAGARLSFFDDETTSISEKGIVNSEKFATAVYDLQGRRVRSAEANSSLFTIHSSLKPGVYIVNGKRVIIK